jgi:hypothetical protein
MTEKPKWGRIEKIVSGGTTYYYKHPNFNASNSDTDWVAIRKVISGSNASYTFKMGSFSNYSTEW